MKLRRPGHPRARRRANRFAAALDRHRRAIVRLCCCALLLLGAGAPLHALAHAIQASQSAAAHDPAAPPAKGCEQCLHYVAIDAALPTADAAAFATDGKSAAVPARPASAQPAAFVAYRSRAPPPAG